MPPVDGSSTEAYRLCSHLVNASEAAPATAIRCRVGHFPSLTCEFDRVPVWYFLLVFCSITIALKCIVRAWNRQIDRQMYGSQHCSRS